MSEIKKYIERMKVLLEYDMRMPNSFAHNKDDESMFTYQDDKEITMEDILKEEEPEEAPAPEETEPAPTEEPQPQEPAQAEAQPEMSSVEPQNDTNEIEAMKSFMDSQLSEIKNSLGELSSVFSSIDELARQHQEISNKIQVLDKKVSDALPEPELSFQERMLNLSGKGSETPQEYFNKHASNNKTYGDDIKFDGKKYYKEVDFLNNDSFVKDTIKNPNL